MEQEIERKGLGCVIQFRCDGSNMTLAVETQPKSKGPGGQLRHSINIAAVWGFMAMGGGHSNMKEILWVLNIPSPDKNTFKKIEEQIGSVWKEATTADSRARRKTPCSGRWRNRPGCTSHQCYSGRRLVDEK